jgi:hypothetical protein
MSTPRKHINDPRISIRLDDSRSMYWPGDVLSGEFGLDLDLSAKAKSVECSVLWHTEGKGEEDRGVHFTQRLSPSDGSQFSLTRAWRFQTELPPSPFSYDGVIVKVRWYVRVVVSLERKEQAINELPFQLGEVAPVLKLTA